MVQAHYDHCRCRFQDRQKQFSSGGQSTATKAVPVTNVFLPSVLSSFGFCSATLTCFRHLSISTCCISFDRHLSHQWNHRFQLIVFTNIEYKGTFIEQLLLGSKRLVSLMMVMACILPFKISLQYHQDPLFWNDLLPKCQ